MRTALSYTVHEWAPGEETPSVEKVISDANANVLTDGKSLSET